MADFVVKVAEEEQPVWREARSLAYTQSGAGDYGIPDCRRLAASPPDTLSVWKTALERRIIGHGFAARLVG